MAKTTTGLALGGIGGFNAHDAGVLAALYDTALIPDVITCTSGAIFWTYQFLTDPEGIPAEVERQAQAVRGANALYVAATGDPKIFAPAYQQYWMRWLRPWASFSANELLDRLLPAQVYEPTRSRADFEQMANAFNETSTPIVFNAFAIASGRELLFCNEAAMRFLGVADHHERVSLVPGLDVTTQYRTIDAAAIETALWLVLYGFEHEYEGQVTIDGAYHRQLIVSELAPCDVIYAVKPQSDSWNGAPPQNYFEVQDFNTEMWFNSSFAAEVTGLKQRAKGGTSPQIVPITMNRPLGFFNYFIEKADNYVEGYQQATKIFEANRSRLNALVRT